MFAYEIGVSTCTAPQMERFARALRGVVGSIALGPSQEGIRGVFCLGMDVGALYLGQFEDIPVRVERVDSAVEEKCVHVKGSVWLRLFAAFGLALQEEKGEKTDVSNDVSSCTSASSGLSSPKANPALQKPKVSWSEHNQSEQCLFGSFATILYSLEVWCRLLQRKGPSQPKEFFEVYLHKEQIAHCALRKRKKGGGYVLVHIQEGKAYSTVDYYACQVTGDPIRRLDSRESREFLHRMIQELNLVCAQAQVLARWQRQNRDALQALLPRAVWQVCKVVGQHAFESARHGHKEFTATAGFVVELCHKKKYRMNLFNAQRALSVLVALGVLYKTEHQVVFEEKRVTWQLQFAFWAKMEDVARVWGKLQAAGVNTLSKVCAASVLRALGAKVARIVFRKRIWPGKNGNRGLFGVLERLGRAVENRLGKEEGEALFQAALGGGVPRGGAPG